MQTRSPHHIAAKLKRTLIITIVSGVFVAGLLALVILVATNRIEDDLQKTEERAISDVGTVLTDKDLFTLPDNTSNIPDVLDKQTLVDVVAKNQPAVVRILTVYCSDVTLSLEGLSFTQKDSCSAGVGSGSIISSDGYIATNGHVVAVSPRQAMLSSLTPEDTQKYLDYLVGTKLLASEKATSIAKGLKADIASASDELDGTSTLIASSTVTSRNTEVHYAVQLSNEPMRIDADGNRATVDFNNTIVEAKLIDEDFDQESAEKGLQTGQFTSSDVALLKMKGSYPYVRLAKNVRMTVGTQLTAIGFPAFVDDSVNTDQWQTVPSITQGKVTEITKDATINGRKIFSTTVPIAQGESGGPAFNDDGEQVGLNTYTVLDCADLKCFGDGSVRDIADLTALLDKNHITLATGGVTAHWYKALDAYVEGNYTEALASFQIVQNQYPENYLASPFARYAREQIGSSTDTSSSFQTRTVTRTILLILAGIIVVIIVSTTILILHFTRKHHREQAATTVQSPPKTLL